MLIDTHTHLYWDSFKDDFDEIIQRSINAGVTTVINVGVDVDLSKKALQQVTEVLTNIPNFQAYSTIGIHPHDSVNYSSHESIQQDIEKLEQAYNSNPTKIVAVGECGLDYFFDHPGLLPSSMSEGHAKKLQRQLFQAQIDLAKRLNLPLVVHCRDDRSKDHKNSEAWDEVLQMIDNHPTILHCYSGLLQTTKKVLKMSNVVVSFAGNLTYQKNEYLREAVKILPLEKIVLETDCPFLPPQSKRGQRNEPANVKETAQLVAELKNLSFAEIANQTTANVKTILE